MHNRRDFLRRASLLLAGGVAPQLFSSCHTTHTHIHTHTHTHTTVASESLSSSAMSSGKYIGLQLYSLRDMVKDEGIRPVLETVAKMGYKNLETADYSDGKIYGLAPAEFKKIVNDLGMKCTSAHLSQAFSPDKETEIMAWWDQAIEAHNQAGCKYLVQPWMPVNHETTLDDVKMYCDYFTSVGYKAAAASMAFGYHNHDFEFKKIGGKLIYDYMLNNVSKNHVFFELDVYWCQVGGYNPVDYLKKYASQIKTVHIKDVKEIGASGTMNFKPIFEQMKANNIKDWYVEVEQYTNNNPQESVKESYDYLQRADYVY